MGIKGFSRERQRINGLYRKLIACDPVKFPRPREQMNAPTARGVYLILNPRGTVLHVGSTPRAANGIKQRLYGHLQDKSSFVNVYMKHDGDRLRSGYMFKYVVVNDPRQRALLEAYAIGQLLPKHIGTGQRD